MVVTVALDRSLRDPSLFVPVFEDAYKKGVILQCIQISCDTIREREQGVILQEQGDILQEQGVMLHDTRERAGCHNTRARCHITRYERESKVPFYSAFRYHVTRYERERER